MATIGHAYVLDANAVIDYLTNGHGALRVEQLLNDAHQRRNTVLISGIHIGEVFYLLWQREGQEVARKILGKLTRLPMQILPVDLPQSLKAAELKTLHKIPYVDCLAAALATLHQATLVTSDRDFKKLGRNFPVLWLHRP